MFDRRQLFAHGGTALVSCLLSCLISRWGMAPPEIRLFPPVCPQSPETPQPVQPSPVPVAPLPVPSKPDEPITPPAAKPDPRNAIVRISARGAGCSATIIGPRRKDGRYDVLTAAHCVRAGGEKWRIEFRDGKTASFTVNATDDTSDCAWGVTDEDIGELPFALLAERSPAIGERVWHSGWGIRVPGNLESGTVIGRRDSRNQIAMRLSVSSGDSGGGIAQHSDGRIVSVVCCTVGRGFDVETNGASVEAMVKLRKE